MTCAPAHTPPILRSDEKLFLLQDSYTTQNDRVYGKEVTNITMEAKTVSRHQNAVLMMVWAGVTDDCKKSPFVFIPEGMKVNQHIYLSIFEDDVKP